MKTLSIGLTTALVLPLLSAAQDDARWKQAEQHGRQSQEAIRFCLDYADGWLKQADPVSGLLPRRLTGDYYWNARDCAADNFPFLTLVAYVTGQYHLQQAAAHILEQEQQLTNRVDNLPDTFDFLTQGFREPEINWNELIFGASEYAKDGLMPITEWMGPTPWQDRMFELIRGVWAHPRVETPVGIIPSDNIEVNGELLQTMSRQLAHGRRAVQTVVLHPCRPLSRP